MHGTLSVSRRSFAVLFGLCLVASAAPSSADVWDNDPTNEDDSSAPTTSCSTATCRFTTSPPRAASPMRTGSRSCPGRSRPTRSWSPGCRARSGARARRSPWTACSLRDGPHAGVAPPGGLGGSQSVRWANNTASQVTDYIRVDGGETMCAINCTTDAQYTIRMWETTGAISRFNNSGTQSTILMLQNPTDYAITGIVYFWDPRGDTGRRPCHSSCRRRGSP